MLTGTELQKFEKIVGPAKQAELFCSRSRDAVEPVTTNSVAGSSVRMCRVIAWEDARALRPPFRTIRDLKFDLRREALRTQPTPAGNW